MEGVKADNHTKKRARVDSFDSVAKHAKLGSGLDLPESFNAGLTESGLDSPELNRFPHDILDILDEPEKGTDGDPETLDLDSVIRSFEEEIFPLPAEQQGEIPVSGFQFGYLFDASDDDLGLPPVVSSSDGLTDGAFDFAGLPEAGGLDEILGVGSELPSGGDSFGLGRVNEFDSVGGLSYDEDASDFSEFLWKPVFDSSSLHAL